MKEFRKENNKLVCEECGKLFVNINGLAQHVNCYHNIKKYFNKWIKEKDDDKCKICNKITNFYSLTNGYKNCCSKECSNKYKQQRTEEENLKKYGVKNTYQRKDIQEKCEQLHLKKLGVKNPRQSKIIQNKAKQTCKEKYGDENYNNPEKNKLTCLMRYGVEHPLQSEKIKEKSKQTMLKKYGVEYSLQCEESKEKYKQTCLEKYNKENPFQSDTCKEKSKQTKLEKYGDKNYNNSEKYKQTCQEKWSVDNAFQSEEIKKLCKQTCLEHFGVEYSMQSEKVKEKNRQTCLQKYGVEHPSQNKEIYEKNKKSGFKAKTYKDTDIYYRGRYELDFLEKHYDKYPDIQNAPSIKYIFERKQHYYFPDFFIPSLNLIIEIKSEWIIKQQGIEMIEAKKKATIANGFNYIMILEKNYSMLENLLQG